MFDSNGADRFQILSLAAANEPDKPGQQLREYQLNGIKNIKDAYAKGARRVLMVLPTGGGKTSCFVHMAAEYAAAGKRTLILVHRRELAKQAADRLSQFGIDFGHIVSGMPRKPYAPVQIATVQTLSRRDCPKADFVVCDEAHLSAAESWTKILAKYPHAKILGVTATPFRLGGIPLADVYDATIVVAKPAELRAQNFLSPFRGFSYLAPDLNGVKITGGDFNEQQSGKAMSEPQLVANIVEEWKAHASELSTVVFATTIEHSKQITAQFKAAGVKAEHLDGKTDVITRDAILRRVASGETRVLVNVGVLVEGIDIPRLKCCVLARPTMSIARAIQMMGRVRRPWHGVAARIHDHAFNIKRHGLPDADLDYTLHARSDRNTEELPVTTTCPACFAIYEGGGACPECGAGRREQDRTLRTVDDAEKFEFEGDAGGKVERAPVEIKWTDVGKSVEGIYRETFKETTPWGDKNRHMVEGTKRRYVLHGTADLDARLKKVSPGKKVRVTFQGTTSLGQGMTRKDFTVEVDEPARECVVCKKQFKPRNSRAKTCSKECRDENQRLLVRRRMAQRRAEDPEGERAREREQQRNAYKKDHKRILERQRKHREAQKRQKLSTTS